jgi:hypothetical protein
LPVSACRVLIPISPALRSRRDDTMGSS